jgi:DNA replication ATP-dependent helicase Dna2
VVDYDSPIAQLYEAKTAHLSASHLAFFQKWEELVTFEEQDVTRFASELWTMSAEEREKKGRCVLSLPLFNT